MPAPLPQLVVLDTETTGLDPERDRIIDIGAVRLGPDLVATGRFQTLVDPGVPVPLSITRLTGITDADVREAPGFVEAYAGLRRFAGDAMLAGHNVGFDREHLAAAARRAGLPPPGARGRSRRCARRASRRRRSAAALRTPPRTQGLRARRRR